jgi:hypothetical protein
MYSVMHTTSLYKFPTAHRAHAIAAINATNANNKKGAELPSKNKERTELYSSIAAGRGWGWAAASSGRRRRLWQAGDEGSGGLRH